MDSHEIQELIQTLDDAYTQAAMLRIVADDIMSVLYRAQQAIAQLQHERDGRFDNGGRRDGH